MLSQYRETSATMHKKFYTVFVPLSRVLKEYKQTLSQHGFIFERNLTDGCITILFEFEF